MDGDDCQVGRILSRREVFALCGAAGAVLLVGCRPQASSSTQPTGAAGQAPADVATAPAANAVTTPACVVRPEVTEGPYYVEEDLVRSDIRSDPSSGAVKQGAPLVLTFSVLQVSSNTCRPLQGATLELWHCDAAGIYSDVTDPGFNTKGQKFLRGSQVTDAEGRATFTTIYPGWYASRAVHIHFKVHPTTSSVFTSQLFFDEVDIWPCAADGRYTDVPATSGIAEGSARRWGT